MLFVVARLLEVMGAAGLESGMEEGGGVSLSLVILEVLGGWSTLGDRGMEGELCLGC